jgi:hemerythrin-like domain-containing protein
MLRDPTLVPLSQQHHNGLALCVLVDRALSRDDSEESVRKQAARIVETFGIEIANHFELEEQVLFPAIVERLGPYPMVDDLLADHARLRELVAALNTAPGRDTIDEFTALLRQHIRREENELFQDIQARLPRDVLEAAGAEIDARAVRVCILP